MTDSRAYIHADHSEARQARRMEIRLGITLSSSALGRKAVRLLDISAHGCCADTVAGIPVGTYVVVTIPGYAPIGAQVRWTNPGHIGLRFNAPLHPAIVGTIAQRG